MMDFAELRERMVERQIATRGIREREILEAFRAVPREKFVSADYAHLAYEDRPLPIEAGQTISQPYVVALMIEGLAPSRVSVGYAGADAATARKIAGSGAYVCVGSIGA